MSQQPLPGAGLTAVTKGFLAVTASLHAVAAGLAAEDLATLMRLPEGGMGLVMTAMSRHELLAFVPWAVLGSYLLLPVMLGLHLQRAHKNLSVLGATGLQYRSGTAVTMWWVPLVNLALPFAFQQEVHRASIQLHGRPVAAASGWMWVWVGFVAGGLHALLVPFLPEPLTRTGMETMALVQMVMRAVSMVAVLVGLMMVRSVERHQLDAWRRQQAPSVARLMGHQSERGAPNAEAASRAG